MDSLIAAAARALASGDPLQALKHVALRNDPSALALRGIAMAQLRDYRRARELLRSAARRFGAREALSRARCEVAEAEVALAMRDVSGPSRALESAAETLDALGDQANAVHARLIAARRLLLLGRVDACGEMLSRVDVRALPPPLVAVVELIRAELALRSLDAAAANASLDRAARAADRSHLPALVAEVADARLALTRPAARLVRDGDARPLRLDEAATILRSGDLVIDSCRRALSVEGAAWPLARRPVLFALARALAEAWPADVDRNALIAAAFRARRPDASHRARLRVEIGRLRTIVAPVAEIRATARGFVLTPSGSRRVVVLAPPIDGEPASLLALLADGEAWSTSALAQALGASQRTVQRALVDLEAEGRVRSVGRARARRWLAPSLAGFTTVLLLPAALPLA